MPYSGASFLADTSAWASIRKKSAPAASLTEFLEAVENGQIYSSPVVRLEMTWGARNMEELDDKEKRLAKVPELALTADIIDRATASLRSMIGKSPGLQKVPIGDALIAATAQANGLGVLHYDKDFVRIAPAFGVPVQRVAPEHSIQ